MSAAAPTPPVTSASISCNTNDWLQNLDTETPYECPPYSQDMSAEIAALMSPSDYFIPTASLPSFERATMSHASHQGGEDDPAEEQQHDFPAISKRVLASRHVHETDKARPFTFIKDEVATPPAPTYTHRSRKRAISDEVPQRGTPSGLEEDAQTAAAFLIERVEAATNRVTSMYKAAAKHSDALRKFREKCALAIIQAASLEKVKIDAASTLKLARTEASAAKARFESSSRPRRVLNYLKAKWEVGPQPLDEANRRVGEAVRGLRSAKVEAERAWEAVDTYFNKAEAAFCKLRKAKHAHTSAETILVDLKAELVRAERQAVRTAREVTIGRCLGGDACAGATCGKMNSLFVAGRVAARLEDGFSDDQVAPETRKRARH